MPIRPDVVVRTAEREDAAALVDLWRLCADDIESASPAHTSTLWREPTAAEAAEAFEQNFGGGDRCMVVALVDGEIVGAICYEFITLAPINLTKTLLISALHVAPEYRRKSVATTLLSVAANAGEEAHCEVILTVTPANAREPNRFLTRLGFGQVSTVRGAQASMLRSKLSSKATNSKDTGKLIAVRRTLRRRQAEMRRQPLSP